MIKWTKLSWLTVIWLLFFLALPLLLLVALSFAQKGVYGGIDWTLNFVNYNRAFSWTHFRIFWRSVEWAFLAALICSVLSFGTCWILMTVRSNLRIMILGFLCLPALINVIIRLYALKNFVGTNGPWPRILDFLSIPYDPQALTANPYLVLIGFILSYWPWALLPLYASFERMDFSLVEAAQDLRANFLQVFKHILWPQLKLPCLSSFLLVFIPCLGEFVIPDILGGAKSMNFGNLLVDKFLKSRDWPLGASLSIILIIGVVISFSFQKMNEERQ